MKIERNTNCSNQSYNFARPLGPTASGITRTTRVIPSTSKSATGIKAYSVK